MNKTKLFWLIVALVTIYSCRPQRPEPVILPPSGYSEIGIASWYGPEFHGRPTSSLEIFDMNDLTAAHRTLPFGTLVLVTNLDNGRTVTVRINDRGPFLKDRIIDLSYAAARMLGMIGPGTARVRIEIAGFKAVEERAKSGEIILQMGAFLSPDNARVLYLNLKKLVPDVFISPFQTADRTFYRVRLRVKDESEAKIISEKLASSGYPVLVIKK